MCLAHFTLHAKFDLLLHRYMLELRGVQVNPVRSGACPALAHWVVKNVDIATLFQHDGERESHLGEVLFEPDVPQAADPFRLHRLEQCI